MQIATDIYMGDSREELKNLPDNSVDLIVTSPPYADQRRNTYGGISPDDYVQWFLPISEQLLRVLKPDGTLFISFPIANQNEVHFNAHRAFHPKDIFTWMKEPDRLKLERFDYVDDAGDLHKNVDLNQGQIDIEYGCGIYTLRKLYWTKQPEVTSV